MEEFFCSFPFVSLGGPSGDVKDRFVVDSSEDFGDFRCLGVEILKKAKKTKNAKIGLVLRRFSFVSLVVPSSNVGGLSAVEYSEDLRVFGGLGVEILEKPKKHEFSSYFCCFGFVLFGGASGDVGGCSGDGRGVDLAAFGGLGVKKSKWGKIFAFLVIFGVSVAHRGS